MSEQAEFKSLKRHRFFPHSDSDDVFFLGVGFFLIEHLSSLTFLKFINCIMTMFHEKGDINPK